MHSEIRLRSTIRCAVQSGNPAPRISGALKCHEVSALREVMAQTDLALTCLDLHDRKIMGEHQGREG